jgi:ATP-dependent protease HslVU (ClpYQ) peptidase subunit
MKPPSSAFGRADDAPRLADWGFNVTVCIAAICDHDQTIVLAADSKVSFGDFSSDRAVMKLDSLFTHWITMFAGEDIEHIPFILERVHGLLSATRKRKSAPPTPAQVASALQRAYQERLDGEIESRVLRKYGFSVASFRDHGKNKCTASVYNSHCAKIANVKLSLRFLVAGFDEKNKARIMVGGGEQSPVDYTRLGFWAIGSGKAAALSSLTYHRQRQLISSSVSVEQCAYVVAASKFMAESARDVGKAPNMCTISTRGIKNVFENPMRIIWDEEGAPRLPNNLESRIAPLILTPEEAEKKATEAVEYFRRSAAQKSKDQQ